MSERVWTHFETRNTGGGAATANVWPKWYVQILQQKSLIYRSRVLSERDDKTGIILNFEDHAMIYRYQKPKKLVFWKLLL